MTLAEKWPTALAYDQALLNRATTFLDPTIKQGKLTEDLSGPIRFNGAGKYVCVYRVSNWIVRCFADDAPDDISDRYRAITAFVEKNRTRLPFLVEHQWIEDKGIRIENRIVPFLKVPFVQNCDTLGIFLSEHYTETHLLRKLADTFLQMIQLLEQEQVAHGDLDITNILIIQNGSSLTLKLIDYDGMYVPELAMRGFAPIDLGHINFQHPNTKTLRKFDARMDRFSVLVLYLSLLALAEQPALWDNCGANDTERLLLNATDYANFTSSASYLKLAALQSRNPEIGKCLAALNESLTRQTIPEALPQVLRASGKAVRENAFGKIAIPVDTEPGRIDPTPPPPPPPPPAPVPVAKPANSYLVTFTVIAVIVVIILIILATSGAH